MRKTSGFLHTLRSREQFGICSQILDQFDQWRGVEGTVHEGDPGYLKIHQMFVGLLLGLLLQLLLILRFLLELLTIGKEAKGKTGIEDSSLNLTWNKIHALNVRLTLPQSKSDLTFKVRKDLLV